MQKTSFNSRRCVINGCETLSETNFGGSFSRVIGTLNSNKRDNMIRSPDKVSHVQILIVFCLPREKRRKECSLYITLDTNSCPLPSEQ